MPFAKISGTGSAVPDKIVTNFDLEKIVETSDAWIQERTGIKERRICEADETASDLGAAAAKKALEMANVDISDIDMILVATTTPDHMIFPSTACLIQSKLGAPKTGALDISAACTGFVYGLATAYSYIQSGVFKKVLFIAVDTLSKHLNWKDRKTCILFGDGAGALVLEASDNPEGQSVLALDLHANGDGSDFLIVPSGGSKEPFTQAVLDNESYFVEMDGPAVYKFAVNIIVNTLQTSLEKANLKKEDIDFFVPHQANYRIIDFAAKKMSLSKEQVKMNLEHYGNTSSASIPLLLDELNRKGQLKKGDIVATVGFGAGLTWGSAIIKW